MSAAVGLQDGQSSSRVWLGLLALFLVIFGLNSTLYLVLALWAIVFLLRARLAALAALLPRDYGFVAAALAFGLLTESFAVLVNTSRPPSEPILLSPGLARDPALSAIYYFAVAVTWLVLLRRFAYDGRDLLLITGLYGVLVAETGHAAVRIITWSFLGPLYAGFVVVLYGVFPMLALMIAGGRFAAGRAAPGLGARAAALIALLAQNAIVGLLVVPVARSTIGA
jgi:hypothetical protein